MAIAFDTSVDQQTNGGGTTLTYSFTTTGTDRYLFVGALIQSSQTITGVTYGGVAMTQIATVSTANVSGGETSYLFGLANPASGANDVVITGSGAATIASVASSFTGAQQTTASEASNTATGANGTATASVTTVTDNDWLVAFGRGQSNITASTNTTMRGATGGVKMLDSNAVQTPPGAFSQNFTTSGNNNWGIIVAALKPLEVAVTAIRPNNLTLLGVS